MARPASDDHGTAERCGWVLGTVFVATRPHNVCAARIPALVPGAFVVPAAVVEVGVVVNDLGAVQPMDQHPGTGRAGVVLGIDGSRAAEHPEPGSEWLDRTMPRRRPCLHETVVVGDVRRGRVARRRGHEQQPELAVDVHPGRFQRPVVRHLDLTGAGRSSAWGRRRYRHPVHLVVRLRPHLRQREIGVDPVTNAADRAAVQLDGAAAGTAGAERHAVAVEVARLHRVGEFQRDGRFADRAGIVRPAPHAADIQPDIRPPGRPHRLAHGEADRHRLARPVGRPDRRRDETDAPVTGTGRVSTL